MGVNYEIGQKETKRNRKSLKKGAKLNIKTNNRKITSEISQVKVLEWPEENIIETKKVRISRQKAQVRHKEQEQSNPKKEPIIKIKS